MGDNVVLNCGSGNAKKLNGQPNLAARRLDCNTSNQQVVHLLISEDLGISKASDGGTQMFVLYEDIFICGTCHQQVFDIISFLQHKSQHTLGCDLYRCELCSCVMPSSAALISHYGSEHSLALVSAVRENGHHASTKDQGRFTMDVDKPLLPEVISSTVPASAVNETQTIFDVTGDENVSSMLSANAVYKVANVRDDNPVQSQIIRNKVKVKRRHQIQQAAAPVMVGTVATTTATTSSSSFKVKSGRQTNLTSRGGGNSKQADIKVGRRSGTISVFPCTTCGKVFRQRRYLHKHVETHGAAHACDVCGKTYRSRAYLRLHSRRHSMSETVSRPRFTCSECDFTSDVAAAIHAHRQVHAPSDSVRCAICGGAYADRTALSKHRRVHDAARPYACPLPGCAWRFRTDVMCRAHVRAHSIAGRFNCSTCGYVFRRKHHLQRHVLRMHADAAAATTTTAATAAAAKVSTNGRSNGSNVQLSVSSFSGSTARCGAVNSSASSNRSARSSRHSIPATITRPVIDDDGANRTCRTATYTAIGHVTPSIKTDAGNDSLLITPDVLLSTVTDDKDVGPVALTEPYDPRDLLGDVDSLTAFLDGSDVDLVKKNGHFLVDDFDLFH